MSETKRNVNQKVRVFNLGSLEHKILPSKEMVEELERVIKEQKDPDDNTIDIVWGPDLDVKVIY